jgi:hypothetical protein
MRCESCQDYQFPPEDSKRRADEGFCRAGGHGVNERDCCVGWRKREDEEE